MKRWMLFVLSFVIAGLGAGQSDAQIGTQQNLFFLHHSTGRNLLNEGSVRAWIDDYNQATGSNFVLWDHDYNSFGLKNPSGALLGYSYEIPNDNTDPDGLYELWTTDNSARDSIMCNHEVVAFKSCYYPTARIDSETELAQYKTWYLAIRDFIDTYPNTTFVIMSPPPLHPAGTNVEQADRVRNFANWLGSDEYLSGHDNMTFFDFFDLLATPDDGSDGRNMLRSEYFRNDAGTDWHPGPLANETVGPIFAEFLTNAARVSDGQSTLGGVKALFR